MHVSLSLATFYFATNGNLWKNNTNWVVSPVPECQCNGIYCNTINQVINMTLRTSYPFRCTINVLTFVLDVRRYIVLTVLSCFCRHGRTVADNNLVGTLPNELSTLYVLDRLELFSNNISGSFPDGVQNVTNLQVLDVESNQLSGPAFSPTLLTLSNLRQLFLSRNTFNGMLPSNLADPFPFLTDLWFADNEIVGPLPTTIGLMTNLRTFIAYGNQLDSTIPSNIGNVSDLTNLQLYRNLFDATIPTQIYGLTKLSVLRLDQNSLTGTISSDIGQLIQLADLRFSNNILEGTIPQSIQQLQNLSYLVMNNNIFSGSIPDVFSKFDALLDLDFSTAFFTGSIPRSLFVNAAIQNIYLSNNALTGTIPSNYSNPLGLIDLYFDNNLLNGTVPSVMIGDFVLLTELLLQNNKLSGTIPTSICALRNISLENLFTDCGGATPEIICTFPTCCNRCFAGGQVTNQRTRRQLKVSQQQQRHQQRDQNILNSNVG
jgi:Leucine-rich repeat (LRR) protein